jgi:Zinc-finger associated domain (zf-AD)
MEISKTCRICLKPSENLVPVLSHECDGVPILNIYRKICYNIRFIPNQNDTSMPKNLCLNCVKVLSEAHKLNETNTTSELKLQWIHSASHSALIKEEEGILKIVDDSPQQTVSTKHKEHCEVRQTLSSASGFHLFIF